MCARYTLAKAEKDILEAYSATMVEPFTPNYNLAPTHKGLVITAEEPNVLNPYHFGLIPHWAQDKKKPYMNARSETILDLKSFKPLMQKNKRCLVLADSFYEWEKVKVDPRPYRLFLPDRDIFSFAGLCSFGKARATELDYKTYTITTTTPNNVVGQFHDRMRVILTKEEENMWLKDGVPMSDLVNLCQPFPEVEMDLHSISKDVNKVFNNHSNLILPENSL